MSDTITAVFGFLAMFAVGIAHLQGESIPLEEVSFSYGPLGTTAVQIKISIGTSATKFLGDPVQTLRQKRLAVPESAEAPLARVRRRVAEFDWRANQRWSKTIRWIRIPNLSD